MSIGKSELKQLFIEEEYRDLEDLGNLSNHPELQTELEKRRNERYKKFMEIVNSMEKNNREELIKNGFTNSKIEEDLLKKREIIIEIINTNIQKIHDKNKEYANKQKKDKEQFKKQIKERFIKQYKERQRQDEELKRQERQRQDEELKRQDEELKRQERQRQDEELKRQDEELKRQDEELKRQERQRQERQRQDEERQRLKDLQKQEVERQRQEEEILKQEIKYQRLEDLQRQEEKRQRLEKQQRQDEERQRQEELWKQEIERQRLEGLRRLEEKRKILKEQQIQYEELRKRDEERQRQEDIRYEEKLRQKEKLERQIQEEEKRDDYERQKQGVEQEEYNRRDEEHNFKEALQNEHQNKDYFLSNICANILAFDEFIGKYSTFDKGNNRETALREITNIVKLLINDNIVTTNVTIDILKKYLEIVNETKTDIPEPGEPFKENGYYLVGWEGHAITIFYEKNDTALFDVGIINAGEGIDIQGYNNILCNGVIIFKNIDKDKIISFLEDYYYYYIKKELHNIDIIKNINPFYFILFDNFYKINKEINFFLLFNEKIKVGAIEVLKINTQIIGSCSFTNHINYINYLIFKTDKINYNTIFNDFYIKSKNHMKQILYNEIISSEYNINKYYNELNYIVYSQDLCMVDIKKNINISNIHYTKYPKKIYILNKSSIKEEIMKNIDYECTERTRELKKRLFSILWSMYNFEKGCFKQFIDYCNELSSITDFLSTDQQSKQERIYRTIKPPDIKQSNMEFIISILIIFYKNAQLLYCDNNLLPILLLFYIIKKDYVSDGLGSHDEWIDCLYNFVYKSGSSNTIYKHIINYIHNLSIMMLLYKHKYEYVDSVNPLYTECKCIYGTLPIINHYYSKYIEQIIIDLDKISIYLPFHSDLIFFETDKIIIKKNFHKIDKMNSIINEQLSELIRIKALNEREPTNLNINLVNNNNNFLYYVINDKFDESKLYKQETYSSIYKYQDTDTINLKSIKDNTGNFIPIQEYIKIYKQNIYDKLFTNDKLLYTEFDCLIYFYLCEYDGTFNTKEYKNIYNKYETFIINELIIIKKYDWNNNLFKIIVLRNDIDFKDEINVIINSNSLISKSELSYFNNTDYTCNVVTEINDPSIPIVNKTNITYFLERYSSIINFYTIQNKINPYTIFIYENNQNTEESVKYILSRMNNYYYPYIALNFYFKNEDGIMKGYHKENKNYMIELYEQNMYIYHKKMDDTLYTYYIINFDTIPIVYYNFYKLLTYNELVILFYKKNDEDIFYLELDTYNLIFILKNNKVYYNLNGNEYEVYYNHDNETYQNYSILKIKYNDDIKLLCMYNYRLLIEKFNKKHNYYILDSKELKLLTQDIAKDVDYKILDNEIYKDNFIKYKINFYTIINSYEDKYMLKNNKDILAILFNCLIYNNSELIFKSIRCIQTLCNNIYNNDTNFFIYLLSLFDNIYAMPINILLKKNLNLKFNNFNSYNYEFTNYLLKKYNIDIEYTYNNFIDNKFTYKIVNLESFSRLPEDDKEYIMMNDIERNKFYNKKFLIFKRQYYIYHTDNSYYVTTGIGTGTKELRFDIEKIGRGRFNGSKYGYNQELRYNITYINENSTILYENKIINSKNIVDIKNIFYQHQLNNINNLDKIKFDNNIEYATKLYEYLISVDRTTLYNIQEILMGSGKSSSITPYICILLIKYYFENYFINYGKGTKYINHIFIVMPSFLINQSFETLMIFLFPIYNNIEIIKVDKLIDNIKVLYTNTINIILISDTDLKYNCLLNKDNFNDILKNSYVIYDEIDLMSNPLTCELNIPYNKTNLENTEQIFDISKKLYKMLSKDSIWSLIDPEMYEFNGLHYYLINKNDKIIEIINNYYDKTFDDCIYDENLLKHIKENILFYILENQYNYNYGMPEIYVGQFDNKYKFKAIPYSSGDSPSYGSDFSDPILTYVLTYFCYTINYNNYKLRKMDKILIIDNLLIIYNKSKTNHNKQNITSLFDININLETFDKYKKTIMNNIKKKFIVNDTIIEQIFKYILNLNINYNRDCSNISFNDLLLYKNVNNFIGFTGTAYMSLPINISNNFSSSPINYGLTKIGELEYNVDQTIDYIMNPVNNKFIGLKYNNNNNDYIIDDVFDCLLDYSILIDIGGYFINYSNKMFINRYKLLDGKKRKNIIVYFDNGIKIYNLDNDKFEEIEKYKSRPNTLFFYFSNKNITGVDAKEIMNLEQKALVTITNKTTIRDFSQGIFRMRNIHDITITSKQVFDILISKKMMFNIVGRTIDKKSINDESLLCHITLHEEDNLHGKILKILKDNQNEQNNINKKMLYKQNIFALIKSNLYIEKPNNQILYLDPSVNSITKNIQLLIEDKFRIEGKNLIFQINESLFEININNINIELLNVIKQCSLSKNVDINRLILTLYIEYIKIKSNFPKVIENISLSEKKIETEMININIEKNINININIPNIDDIEKLNYINFKYKHSKTGNILDPDNTIFILYDDNLISYTFTIIYTDYNTIYLLDCPSFIKFIMVFGMNKHFSFITLNNNNIYGTPIEEMKKYFIIYLCKDILNNLFNIAKYELNYTDIEYHDKNKDKYNKFENNFLIKSNGEIKYNILMFDKHQFRNKYLKYKNKYINLKKLFY
jgi:hypothetical protein